MYVVCRSSVTLYLGKVNLYAVHVQQPPQSGTDPLVTRVSLLERACANPEGDAWTELLSYYKPFIVRVLKSLGYREPELSDIQQEVFVKLWKGLELYKRDTNRAKFRTWFSVLIRNVSTDYARATKRRKIHLEAVDPMWASTEDSKLIELIESEWRRHVVDIAMARVRTVFSGQALKVCLLTLQDFSAEDIAKQLNLKIESVYMLRYRVKARLVMEIKQLKQQLEIPHMGRADD